VAGVVVEPGQLRGGGPCGTTGGSVSLHLVPVKWREACAFIDAVHRHHGPPHAYNFAVGVADSESLRAVAIAGRPVSRMLADGWTIEILRVASDGVVNGCSMLYGACWRAAKALGYRRAVTYIQDGETGASLKAAGWRKVADLPANPGWDRPSRPRAKLGTENVARERWEITTADYEPGRGLPRFPDGGSSVDRQLSLLGEAS